MRVSPELLAKYDRPGPRYTSYPTAPMWRDTFGAGDHRESLERASREDAGLSLYVHIPFCERLCVYCGCSTVITRRLERGRPYVDRVLREARTVREAVGGDRSVVQHHWGGGTPTFLPAEELARLAGGLHELFPLATDDPEVSLEVDPRVTTPDQLEALRAHGFNRISMGVQDFDPAVQEAIHRVQSFEQTRDLVVAARDLGYESVNLDLVYGLPRQRVSAFAESIERVLELRPDRVACYSYAHVPWLKRHQAAIDEAWLPRGADKVQLYLTALDAFVGGGYEPIGMDHFARRGDRLFAAADAGALHRNFQGYTTKPATDLVGLGVTAISEVAGAFAQNAKDIHAWEARVDAGELATERGLRRTADDERRRAVILDLMCRFRLRFDDHGGREAFVAEFGEALEAIRPMADDGLAEIHSDGIDVTEIGRLFVRNLCMPFDAYAKPARADQPMFSRTV